MLNISLAVVRIWKINPFLVVVNKWNQFINTQIYLMKKERVCKKAF